MVTTDDEIKFEQLVVRYFVWKQNKLISEQRSSKNSEKKKSQRKGRSEQSHVHVDLSVSDQETQKCKQVVEILQDGHNESFDADDLNNSIPEILKQVTTITETTDDSTSTPSRKRRRKESYDEDPTWQRHTLRDEVELIVDYVQKANSEEIEQLRTHNERLNHQLLQYLEKRSKLVTSQKKSKIVLTTIV